MQVITNKKKEVQIVTHVRLVNFLKWDNHHVTTAQWGNILMMVMEVVVHAQLVRTVIQMLQLVAPHATQVNIQQWDRLCAPHVQVALILILGYLVYFVHLELLVTILRLHVLNVIQTSIRLQVQLSAYHVVRDS